MTMENQPFEDVFPIETVVIFPGENLPLAGNHIHLAVVEKHHLKYTEVMIPYIFYLKHFLILVGWLVGWLVKRLVG